MPQNWFKHDYNARNDDKVLELRSEMGWEGYGLFFAIVEMMCENEQGFIDPQKIGGLSLGLGVSKARLNDVIGFCIDIGLFYISDDEMIRSNRVDSHVDKMLSYVEAGKKGAKKRWKKETDGGANKGANRDPNADKSRKDKIKEDNTNTEPKGSNIPSLSEVKEYFSKNGYDPNVGEKAWNYYNESVKGTNKQYWRDSNDKMIKSWKMKMRGVWFKPENEQNNNGVISAGEW